MEFKDCPNKRDPRFRGVELLFGAEHFRRISSASVCVVGLGGVGSWCVEALARSGIGALTLVDLDDVCVTNINRQIHALTQTIGRSKAELLGERVRAINPACHVTLVRKFFSANTADEILAPRPDIVIDTIDSNEAKTILIGECVRRGLRVVTVGSAGDRTTTSTATVADLACTIHDPLLQIVRKQLRQRYDFPKGERARFHVPCIYAPQQRGPKDAQPREECSTRTGSRRSCNDGLGSVVFVTGALGFAAAGEVINILGQSPPKKLYPWVSNEYTTN